jgi:hypothetical protein
MRYRELDSGQIILTIQKLERRVGERFPESGLRRLVNELLGVAGDARLRAEAIARPNVSLRVAVGILIAAILVIVASALASLNLPAKVTDFGSLAQALDAGINDIVFIGLAIFFLVSLERRLKRRRALRALHELRSLAHIVDMHQLTKDPERIVARVPEQDTASSPQHAMTRFELGRYLDYCTELLSLISKIAALYVQRFDDEVTLGAVNEVESLTSGLSKKIWQKIMILDSATAGEA